MTPNRVEYKAYDAETEIQGRRLKGILFGMNMDAVRPLLVKYRLDTIEDEHWYRLQDVLDFFTELENTPSTMFDLVALGMKVSEVAAFPPELDTLMKVMTAMSQLHTIGYRNGDPGEVRVEVVGDRHIRLHVRAPMPADLIYGIYYGTARRFPPPGGNLVVRREVIAPDQGIYDISW